MQCTSKFYCAQAIKDWSKSIRIAGLRSNYSPEELLNEITSCGHNYELEHLFNNQDNFRVHEVKAYKHDCTRFWASVTVSDDIHKIIVGRMGSHLKTTYLRLKVFDAKPFRCNNCQGLDGHLRKDCTNDAVCAKCAGNHATDTCDISEESFRCVNCSKIDGADANHRADSALCPAFKTAVNKDNSDENKEKRGTKKSFHTLQDTHKKRSSSHNTM